MDGSGLPAELISALLTAPDRTRVNTPAEEWDPGLVKTDRHGVVRLTNWSGTEVFIDFRSGTYLRAHKSNTIFHHEGTWTPFTTIDQMIVGERTHISSGVTWYMTSTVRYIDQLID